MLVSQTQLQKIVDEMENSIHKSINIMDETGKIIASTDKTRLNQIHQGAVKVIEDKLEMLIIDSDSSYDGSLPGINLPIIFKGEIAGVVGITGIPKEVTLFGKLIRQTTELLIANVYQQQQKKAEEDERNLFLYQWLFNNQLSEIDETFKKRGLLLKIDITLPRAAILFHPTAVDSASLKKLFSIVKRHYPQNDGHIVMLNGDKLILFYHSPSHSLPHQSLPHLKESAETILKLSIAIGVGCFARGRQELQKSLKQSESACLLAAKNTTKTIQYYQEANLSFLLLEASSLARQQFLQGLFIKADASNLKSYMELLSCFFTANGSISKTAAKLHIHKNTVQYRLKKIKELTGYDPRLLSESPTLYAALLIYQEQCHLL